MAAIRIATLNTQIGRTLKSAHGLRIFAKHQVDVLLLQEVFGMDEVLVRQVLHLEGYELIAFNRPTGLAIALRSSSSFAVPNNSVAIHILQDSGRLTKVIARHAHIPEHHIRARGVLTATLLTAPGQKVTVATTHPAVFIRHRSRAAHLQSLQHHLADTYSASQPLILGADMNHYPGPGNSDVMFRTINQLTEVPLNEATWLIAGTKYERLARLASQLNHQPMRAYDGRLDTILFRGIGLQHIKTTVVPIESDHRAIISYFSIP